MKKSLIFARVIYYLFTFTLGILLAVMLHPVLVNLACGGAEEVYAANVHLHKGRYADAMGLVGGYYNSEVVFVDEFEGGGMVLFQAITPVYFEEGSDQINGTKFKKAYAGFLFGVGDTYQISGNGSRATITVVNLDGERKDVPILDRDEDKNNEPDSNNTMVQCGLMLLDFDQDYLKSIQSITFKDKDGAVFKSYTLNLSFEEPFFRDVTPFLDEYNNDYKSSNLKALGDALLAKNSAYRMSSTEYLNIDEIAAIEHSADVKGAWIVVGFFAVVYILADVLFGNFYITKGVKWVLAKVFKVQFKQKHRATKHSNEQFGHDYYSQVTMMLDVDGLEDFSQSVQIRYTRDSSDEEEISFILLKENNYTATERIKAGKYVNMWIDIDKNIYGTQNLPEILIVEGYQMGYKVKILRREE